jgi:hypothetical protein
MTRIIHGEGAPYYSQRNNVIDPGTSCGTTAAINALAALGYQFPSGVGQPEDRLIKFIRSDSVCLERYNELDPRHQYPVNQWQEILAIGISRWIGIPDLAHFSEYATTKQIFDHVVSGGAVLVTGAFPAGNGKTLHHTVALIGVEVDGGRGLEDVARWFIRDPWGDHRTLYRDVNGSLVDLLPEEFAGILKTTGANLKWAVFIQPPAIGGKREAP